MTHLMRLRELSLADAGRVGRKAAVLGELIQAGFAVPDGYAIPAATPLGVEEPPPGLVDELRAALAVLDSPVAVRSSGVDEDLPDRSYAGQYESILDVKGLDAVLGAARAARAAAGAERVAAYRAGDGDRAGGSERPSGSERSSGSEPGMGVIVQAMVDARAAGVAFGANPVTGDRDEVLVSAVAGLNDRLTAGASDADEWSVRAGAATMTSGAGAAIDAGLAREIAAAVTRIGERLGGPQDVEWAYDGTRLLILQARPITALPPAPDAHVTGSPAAPETAAEPALTPALTPVPIEAPPGFSTRNRNIDRPWTPLERSVFLPVFSAGSRHIFAFTTGITPRACAIGGWVYINISPDDAEAFAARLESIAAAVAAGTPRSIVERWHAEWKPEFAARLAALRDVPAAELSDADLAAHARAVQALFDGLHDRYFQLTGAAIVLLGELGVTCAELLDWSVADTLRLRSGLDGDHMPATIDISELAAQAAANPALRARLAGDGTGEAGGGTGDKSGGGSSGRIGVDELADLDPAFAAAFAAYLRRHGHRTIGFDLTQPTLAEQPEVLLGLVRAQMDQPYRFDAERAALRRRVDAAIAEAREALADDAGRDRFEAALRDSALSASVRDEKSYYAVGCWALIRQIAFEIGGRLAARGAVADAADTLFLAYDEALAALRDGADQHELVARRRGEHAWALANPGPPIYGTPPAPPNLDAARLSAGAQRALRVSHWSMSVMGGPPPRAAETGITGVAASPGRHLGPARVVATIADFARVRPGDVLVCPETTAQWAMLFPTIGALVTDRGSLLSHPAILAREYGVPAVVATGVATRTLRDGQMVSVDGSAGQVRVVDHPGVDAPEPVPAIEEAA